MRQAQKTSTAATAQRSPRRLSRRRRAVFRIVVLLGVFFILFVAGESVFRVRQLIRSHRLRSALGSPDGRVGSGWAMYDPELGYRNRPDWKDHNADGMRDRPRTDKTDFRILMLGDSIGYYGDTVEQTYPNQLEAILNADRDVAPCDVLNASTRGYTNYQELLYLKRYAPVFEPDLVALGFCLNDVHKFLHTFAVVDGKIVDRTYQFTRDAERSVSGGGWLSRMASQSLFLSWLGRRTREAAIAMNLRAGYAFDARVDINTAWKDAGWPDVEDQISQMAALCRERAIRLCLIVFPHATQYRDKYLERDRDYVLSPQRRLRGICDRLKIPMLDLYPVLDESLLERDGIHLKPDAIRIVAEQIAAFLKREQLVPAAGG